MDIVNKNFEVKGMSCASCATGLEKHLKNKEGIKSATVSYGNLSAQISFEDSVSFKQLNRLAKEIGYELIDPEVESVANTENTSLSKRLFVAVLFSTPVFILSMFFRGVIQSENWILLVLSIPVVFYSGLEFILFAIKRIQHFSFTMDTLVVLSTQTAFWYSFLVTVGVLDNRIHEFVYYESAVIIITFILLGRYLEERAKKNASSAISKLISLQSKKAIVIQNGIERLVTIEHIKIGDLVVIKPGESIPVDGIVQKGNSYVDEQFITGEPMSVLKNPKSKVRSGSINKEGKLVVVAESVGQETLLARVIQMVKQAQGSKAPIQKMADKISSIFVPTVLVIAVTSFVFWYLLFPAGEFSFAIKIVISVLIIACPCALGLATPMALIVGIGKGASKGILIRNGESLERICVIDTIVFDKTGTLTEGNPTVSEVHWKDGFENKGMESILSAIEESSTHPLAGAIVEKLGKHKVEISDVKNVPGRGVSACSNGINYYVGSMSFLRENNVEVKSGFKEKLTKSESATDTVVGFANGQELLCLIYISDQIKASAKLLIQNLKKNNIQPIMLTGDSGNTAESVANFLGIEEYISEVLPDQKGHYIEKLRDQGRVVGMVGDGINDAPALALADVGIAMASGADIAKESADITLLNSNLENVIGAINLSKATMKNIKQNLIFAFIYNLISIPLAAGILYSSFGVLLNPMIAGGAMALSSLSVVLNSLRLKYTKLG